MSFVYSKQYQDLLNVTGWKLVFESVWPRHRDKIDVVARNIEQHSLLMTNEVQLEDIRASHKARTEAFANWESTRQFQDRQDFQAVYVHLAPVEYEHELHRFSRALTSGTGSWLSRNENFKRWLGSVDDSKRLLWLRGIPGAGECASS